MTKMHPGRPSAGRLGGDTALLIRSSYLAALWALLYALYRGYYALGGTLGMFGVPSSEGQWRLINGIGSAILLVGAVLPIILLRLWQRRRLTTVLLGLCWIVAVGCVMHAAVDAIQRVLSLSGILTMSMPFWISIDQRQSDLQDLLFNEPWFLIEGLLWAVMAWAGGVRRSPHRWWWITSALAAVVVLTTVGLLSATGAIGTFIVG
jgi:hypothetical protein